jgi:hypothetical protein
MSLPHRAVRAPHAFASVIRAASEVAVGFLLSSRDGPAIGLRQIKAPGVPRRRFPPSTAEEARMTDDKRNAWKTLVEEIEVSGQHLLAEINKLIAEGNVRKLVVKTDDGHIFLTIPLTAGAVAGGVLTLGAPWLAVLAAVAGVVARVKIEVVREESADAPPPSEEKPSASDEAA